MIKRLFSPPVFNNEQDNFRAKFINGFAWIVITLLTLSLIPARSSNADENSSTTTIFLISLILIIFLSLYMLRRGNLNVSGLIIVVLGWFGFGLQAYAAERIMRSQFLGGFHPVKRLNCASCSIICIRVCAPCSKAVWNRRTRVKSS